MYTCTYIYTHVDMCARTYTIYIYTYICIKESMRIPSGRSFSREQSPYAPNADGSTFRVCKANDEINSVLHNNAKTEFCITKKSVQTNIV